ncbi:40S ribosomal protein [Castilleja foliolosa]|uniref:40S ribosomal protein S8 n=1 Tax=Castilleja foliolosa TaxID=1961234 RepID=A0ABD3CTA9_9LAMI
MFFKLKEMANFLSAAIFMLMIIVSTNTGMVCEGAQRCDKSTGKLCNGGDDQCTSYCKTNYANMEVGCASALILSDLLESSSSNQPWVFPGIPCTRGVQLEGSRKHGGRSEKYELGRQPANTKLSSNKTVRRVRVRGGNVKWRALRLDTGNFSWGSEAVTRKTRILDVVYNASNNELVRTQTLVKGAIIQVDAAPFKQWYLQHYGVEIGRKKKTAAAKKDVEETEAAAAEEAKKSNHVKRKIEKRQEERKIDGHIEEQFGGGRLLAAISSRPGQCGRADGYILEGKELEFYMKKLQRKKGKGAGGA